ncbi:MAG: isoaspartyl peptidase/L-asparaginase [Planctomycetaceae bacterium]|nr:isoaspartyl peptidase/L-asparaginase [Planctomycetaceae bacterium]
MFFRFCLTAVVCLIALECRADEATPRFAIVIHGGAGRISSDPAHRKARGEVLDRVLHDAKQRLADGAAALDVVERVINTLEDAPQFNAGRGAVFNAAGAHELDASIMDGRDRSCGAVAGVRTVRHPITLARRVMTDTRHVLLSSDGAEKFADEVGADIERVNNDWFSTKPQKARLKQIQAMKRPAAEHLMGTVGCVVLDTHGDIAAGTSTGGMTNKKFGRVGDSPIVGAGTFADNATCGVSCTGVGEDFIRNAIAYQISAQMEYAAKSLEDSVHHMLHHPRHQISGGIIAISAAGDITMQFNTDGMSRAAADSSGRHEVHVAE